MHLKLKALVVALAIATGLQANCALAQDTTADQLKTLTASMDRLTSSNQEILRRLERMETRLQVTASLRQGMDSVTSMQGNLLQQVVQLRNQVTANANRPAAPAPAAATPQTTAPAATPSGPTLPIKVDIGPGRMQGNAESTVTLVMFSDSQCGFCFRFLQQSFPTIKKDYLDTGKIRFAMRDLPLASHRDANKGAQAARCAEEQGKYWEMISSIYTQQFDVTTSALKQKAEKVGLDTEAFAACFDSEKHKNAPGADMAKARALGFRSTPCFAIGYSQPGSSEITVTRRIIGARPLEQFITALNQQIQETMPAK